MLAILIAREKEKGQFPWSCTSLSQWDLSILQFADDKILFMDDDLEETKNLKLVLCSLNSYRASKSISAKANCSYIVRHNLLYKRMLRFQLERGDTTF